MFHFAYEFNPKRIPVKFISYNMNIEDIEGIDTLVNQVSQIAPEYNAPVTNATQAGAGVITVDGTTSIPTGFIPNIPVYSIEEIISGELQDFTEIFYTPFDVDLGGWNDLNAWWSIVDSSAYHPLTDTYNPIIHIGMEVGKTYLIEFNIRIDAGVVKFTEATSSTQGGTVNIVPLMSSSQKYSFEYTMTVGVGCAFSRQTGNTTEFYVDYVSVKELTTKTQRTEERTLTHDASIPENKYYIDGAEQAVTPTLPDTSTTINLNDTAVIGYLDTIDTRYADFNIHNEVIYYPGVPTDLTVEKDDDVSVLVSWNAPIDGDTTATDYDVYSYDGLITRSRGFLTLVVDAPPNVAVDYKVRSTDFDGNKSAWSDIVTYTNEVVIGTADFFVTNDGAGTKDGSSIENAMGIAEHNAFTFSAGNVIALSGTFTDLLNVSNTIGAVDNHIVYDGAIEGIPSATFTKLVDAGTVCINSATDATLSYVTFQNILITGEYVGVGIQSYGPTNNINVFNCTLHTLLGDNSVGIRFGGVGSTYDLCQNITIGGSAETGNRFYNIPDNGNIGISNCDGVLVSHNNMAAENPGVDNQIDGLGLFWCRDVVIEYNDMSDMRKDNGAGEDGIDIKDYNDGVIVRYNTFKNNEQTGVTVQMGSRNIEIYGNYFENCEWGGVMLKYGAGGPWDDLGAPHSVDIHHNIFYKMLGYGVECTTTDITNVDVHHNVFMEGALAPQTDSATGISFSQGSNCSIQNNIIYNDRVDQPANDIYSINLASAFYSNLATNIVNHNVYYNNGAEARARWGVSGENYTVISSVTPAIEATGLINDDPLFVNNVSDFHVDVASPCINAGADLGYTEDYEGSPYVTPVNIGAYSTPIVAEPLGPDILQSQDFQSSGTCTMTAVAGGYEVFSDGTGSAIIPRILFDNLETGKTYLFETNETVVTSGCIDMRLYDGAAYLVRDRVPGGTYSAEFTWAGGSSAFVSYDAEGESWEYTAVATLKEVL